MLAGSQLTVGLEPDSAGDGVPWDLRKALMVRLGAAGGTAGTAA